MLMQEFNHNSIIALRLPPPSKDLEYIKPLDDRQVPKQYNS
jgi:hypothetical protein